METFIAMMSERHGFDRQALERLFQKTRKRQKIIDAITRPAESKPWSEYRPIFVTPARIRDGVAFRREHEGLLARAEETYGVPAPIVAAILGVETRYGRYTGAYRVMDALTTLAFHYPPRQKFFRRELEQFLLLAREEGVDPLTIRGSYAGAMGKPQFIASSYRQYAVDFDGDGRRDLWRNTADAVGSVANYFKRHGWRNGEAITVRAALGNPEAAALAGEGIRPRRTVGELRRQGIVPADPLPDHLTAALIRLEGKRGNEYWLGLHNFYVITRYNHSALYAMAVFQLSQEIEAQYRISRALADES